ncbi:MAG: DNA polymerase III subunit chi [Beijerinckiaceae bacterium]|jgi:DNA polymerase III subunit chi|nr:DNA polymerase III subunit chi [Beijerinckiaceae bacterium]
MSDEKPIEISFYHLQMQPLEKVLPVLLEKSVERGWNVVLQTVTEERCVALNEALWTYSDESFLPHGMARDGDPEFQPIYLTNGPENPNGAQIRFFVEGADVAPALADQESEYERLVLMFDGNDEAELARARAQWKALKGQGAVLAYFQQTDDGRWEKKA